MLLKNLPGMAYRCMNDRFWTMEFVSEGVRSLLGYEPDDLIGNRRTSYAMAIHPDDRERVSQEVQQGIQTGQGFQITYRLVTAGGSEKWVFEQGSAVRDAAGNVVALEGFVTDITQARQAEAAIHEADQRFKILAKVTNDAVWDWDLKADTIWWNDGIHTLFGFPADQIEPGSESWTSRIHPDDKEWVLSSVEEVMRSRHASWSAEYRFLRKDGSYAYVLDRGFVIRDADGAPVRMVGGMTDLTARKQSELSLARLNRALKILGMCNEQLVRAPDELQLLHEICRIIVNIGGYRMSWVGLAEADDEKLITPVAHCGRNAEFIEFIRRFRLSWSDFQRSGHSPDARAVRTGKVIVIPDLYRDPELRPWHDMARKHGYSSGVWLPLVHQDQTLGVLALYAAEVCEVSDDELRLLQTLADNLAFGIVNLRSQEQRRRIESATVKVAAGVSAGTGLALFENLARNMADAVGAQASMVSHFLPGKPLVARTIVAIVDGQLRENFDYPIEGTPCAHVLESGSCIVEAHLGEEFPSSGGAGLGMQSYLGYRLDSTAGHPLGVLFVMFRDAMKQPGLVREMIQIFAARAASELERREADLQIREQASLLDKAKDAIVVRGTDNRVRYWNRGAEQLYGWTSGEVVGQIVDDIIYDDHAAFREAVRRVLQDGEWQGELVCRRKDGTALTVETHWTLVLGDGTHQQSIFTITTDVTQRKAAEQEVHALAFYDRLTGLPNRHFLMERLDHGLAASPGAQYSRPCCASTWTISSRSTTPSAMKWGIGCSGMPAGASPPAWAKTTWWPASAETNSWSCSTA